MFTKKIAGLSSALVLLVAMLAAGPKSPPEFDITSYGAKGNDAVDDTAAFVQCMGAAATETNPVIVVPRGTYYVSGTAGGSAITITKDHSTLRGEGVIKLVAGNGADAVVEVQGDYVTIEGVTIDGNGSGSPTGRNECLRVEDDGMVSADYCTVRGVTCQNTKSGGTAADTFFVRGDFALVEGCISLNSGNNGFRNDGDWCVYKNNRCVSCEAKGFTQNGQDREQLTVDGFFCYYDEDNVAAGCGFQVDVGVQSGTGAAVFNGFSLKKANLRNINVYVSDLVATDFGSGIKLARIHQVEMNGFHVRMSSVNASAFKLAEGLGNVKLLNGFVTNNIDMDMSPYDAGGAVTSVTEEAVTGKAVLNVASHVVKDGDYLVVSGSSVDAYNGLYQITQSPTSGLIVINTDYTADATAQFSNCCGRLTVENVIIGDRSKAPSACLSGLAVYDLTVRSSEFRNYVDRGISYQPFVGSPDTTHAFPETAAHSIYVTQCYFESNCPGATMQTSTAPLAAGDSGNSSEWNNRAGFVRWDESNVIRDLGTIASTFTSVATEQGTKIFTRRSGPLAIVSGATRTATEEDSGSVFYCSSSAVTATLPATRAGLRYTFMRAPGGVSVIEVQTVTVTGTPTGGSFTLTITGYGTTPAINYNATLATAASNMQTQLRTLSGLGSVTVGVTGSNWSNAVFSVTFTGTYGDIPTMSSTSSLTGGTPNIAHATTTAGTAGLSISPDSADRIYLPGITAADNKDIISNAATDRVGDSITLIGDGNIGWIVESYTGTWGREP